MHKLFVVSMTNDLIAAITSCWKVIYSCQVFRSLAYCVIVPHSVTEDSNVIINSVAEQRSECWYKKLMRCWRAMNHFGWMTLLFKILWCTSNYIVWALEFVWMRIFFKVAITFYATLTCYWMLPGYNLCCFSANMNLLLNAKQFIFVIIWMDPYPFLPHTHLYKLPHNKLRLLFSFWPFKATDTGGLRTTAYMIWCMCLCLTRLKERMESKLHTERGKVADGVFGKRWSAETWPLALALTSPHPCFRKRLIFSKENHNVFSVPHS